MLARTHRRPIERVSLSVKEQILPDRAPDERWEEFDKRLTSWRVELSCELCYVTKSGWINGERGANAKQLLVDDAVSAQKM